MPVKIPTLLRQRATIRLMEPRSDEALALRFEAALDRIGAFFMGSSPVQEAAAQIAHLLSEMKIDYAIADALCLAAHGVVRDRGRRRVDRPGGPRARCLPLSIQHSAPLTARPAGGRRLER